MSNSSFLKMLFGLNKGERERQERENSNAQQPFFQLPAEIRNQIYSYLLPPGPKASTFRQRWRLPELFHVCRKTRADFIPMFFYSYEIPLYWPYMTKYQLGRAVHIPGHKFPTALCDRSIACLRRICINIDFTCPRCYHVSMSMNRRYV